MVLKCCYRRARIKNMRLLTYDVISVLALKSSSSQISIKRTCVFIDEFPKIIKSKKMYTISGQEYLWREIPYKGVFRFITILNIIPPAAVKEQWRCMGIGIYMLVRDISTQSGLLLTCITLKSTEVILLMDRKQYVICNCTYKTCFSRAWGTSFQEEVEWLFIFPIHPDLRLLAFFRCYLKEKLQDSFKVEVFQYPSSTHGDNTNGVHLKITHSK
jgi:hypothetical protein